jgi:regulator of sigma E protease
VGLIGIAPSGEFETRRVGPVSAIGRTIEQQNEWVGQTLLALWSMITGRIAMRDSVTGPIGILYLTSEAAQLGIAPLLYLISLFSLSLALFNVFPIPILDGGHLFFLLLEKLRGSPISVNIQERAAQVSFVLLMTMVLFICINDVSRFGLLDKVVEWIKR